MIQQFDKFLWHLILRGNKEKMDKKYINNIFIQTLYPSSVKFDIRLYKLTVKAIFYSFDLTQIYSNL